MMKDWNVLVTTQEGAFGKARNFLQRLGAVAKTPYFNVLIFRVEDTNALLEQLSEASREDPGLFQNCLSRVVPLEKIFTFQSPEEFEEKARQLALPYAEQLKGKKFHVRLHRRGFKGRLHSQEEEKFLVDALLHALEKSGHPGRISFEDPDAVLILETLSNQAGMSCFTREQLKCYPFLRPAS